MIDANLMSLLRAQGANPINGLFDSVVPLQNGGGGAFSMVCQARHVASGAPVALKFLVSPDPYRQLCFQREGQFLEKLRGEPAVVELIESPQVFSVTLQVGNGATITQAWPFVALRWLDRGDLGQFRGPPPDSAAFLEALKTFRSACRSVRRVHKRLGIFHRDLKPENLFLGRGGEVVITDLGTARLVYAHHSALPGQYAYAAGDLRYTPPELLAGLHAEPALYERADVFSLGAILFEFLTGDLLTSHTWASPNQLQAFQATLAMVQGDKRQAAFDAFLDGESGSRVPDVFLLTPQLPSSCRPYLQRLVEGMSHFDYRARFNSWEHVYRLIDICIRVVSNDAAYKQMLARRRAARNRSGHV